MTDGTKADHPSTGPPSSAGVSVFVSYRRNEAGDAADNLHHSLVSQSPGYRVFVDIRSIPPGRDFVDEITARIGDCDAVVALIGPNWLEDANGRRRLDDPEDFVRRELEIAFANSIPIVPILIHGATLPDDRDLPESLRPLLRLQAISAPREYWTAAMQRLADRLAEIKREPDGHPPPRVTLTASAPDVTPVPDPPTGVVAMLFTDMEGSTRLASTLGSVWPEVNAAHHAIMRDAIVSHGGWVDKIAGDGFFATFADPKAAARAAVGAQRSLAAHAWPEGVDEVRVRMGLHVGQIHRDASGYVGLEIHRAARVAAAAHGGQVLLTGVAADLMADVVVTQALGAHRLKDFPSPVALFCAVIDGRGAADFPPPRTLEVRSTNLPVTPTVLVGRDGDCARVRAALIDEQERLVTVLGRGGVGKTSLALAVANDVLDDFGGGVWWIPLAGENEPDGLLAAVARACGATHGDSLAESLELHFTEHPDTLLVLDNLEQIPHAGRTIEALQQRSPDLRVLATSQQPLGCRHERRIALDCLDHSDGVALLVASAKRLGIAAPDDDTAMRELVELVDGLPLAIELAAARLRLFAVRDLIERLRSSNDVLRDRSGGRPDRQQSLRAALDWSLDLLDPDARTLFDRLGVFAGPVELGEIEAVLDVGQIDVPDALVVLLDVALVRRVESGDGRVRLGLPEALRQQAAARLDAADGARWRRAHALRQRDLIWPLRHSELADRELVEAALRATNEALAAQDWAWEHDMPLARQITLGRMSLAGLAGAFRECRELLDLVLADPGDDPAVTDFARAVDATLYGNINDRERALVQLRSVLDSTTDPHARLLGESNAAIALTYHDLDVALPQIDRAERVAAEIDPLSHAAVLAVKADTLVQLGRYAEARRVLTECDRLAAGRVSAALQALAGTRGDLALLEDDPASAVHWYTRSLTAADLPAGDTNRIHIDTPALARALLRLGRHDAALEVAGIAQAQAGVRAEDDYVMEFDWIRELDDVIDDARAHVGSEQADALIDRGRLVAAGQWAKRACMLAFTAPRESGVG
jgi:predicted ATPase/class 3 adenylate cyclase